MLHSFRSPSSQHSMLHMLHGCTICLARTGVLGMRERLLATTALIIALAIGIVRFHHGLNFPDGATLIIIASLPCYVGSCTLPNLWPLLQQVGLIPPVRYVSLSLERYTALHTASPDVHHWRWLWTVMQRHAGSSTGCCRQATDNNDHLSSTRAVCRQQGRCKQV